MSALGLLAQSVRLLSFGRDFTFSTTARNACFLRLVLEGVTSVVDCVKCVPIPVKKEKQDDPPPWLAEN